MLTDTIRQVLEAQSDIVLFGIESHVCILQTCLDLLHDNHRVWVVHDAIASQRQQDMQTAVMRMQQAGAVMTTGESVVFEVMRTAEHPRFRAISALYKQ